MDVHKTAEALSDILWHNFDKCHKSWKTLSKTQNQSRKPEKTKTRKRIRGKGCFVLSFFRVFVIKNNIRQNSTSQKHKCPISNFNVP